MASTGPALDDRFFSSGGVRIRYVEAGDGEPVVLLHGFLGDVETSWVGESETSPGVLPTLARRYRTIAMDARGHGRSDKPHDPGQYGARMADDVVALLDHLDVERAHLVGYSMGGMVAAKTLCEWPARMGRVVLGGSAPYVPSLRPEGFPPELARLADDLAAGRGIVDYVLATAREGRYGATRAEAEAVSAHVLAKQDVSALVAVARAMAGLGVAEASLAANPVPVLAIVGTLDEALPELERIAPRMAKLRVRTIEGADHGSTPAHPEFLQGIERFLCGSEG